MVGFSFSFRQKSLKDLFSICFDFCVPGQTTLYWKIFAVNCKESYG